MPPVKLWLVIVLLLVANVVAVGILMLLRRHGPSEGWFRDTQHAAGAFTVTGTIYAVLVGFVFLLAFGSYSAARESSQDEARAALSLFHVAERFPPDVRDEIQGDVVCYARAVVGSEWTTMAAERPSTAVDHWETRLSRDFDAFEPTTQVEGDALQSWFSDADLLREARQGRLTEAPRFIPVTIWVLLLVTGVAVIAFSLLLSDSRERRSAQIAMVIAVTTAVTASLLIVNFLDRPYGEHEGAIKPEAMDAALAAVRRDLIAHDRPETASCATAEPGAAVDG